MVGQQTNRVFRFDSCSAAPPPEVSHPSAKRRSAKPLADGSAEFPKPSLWSRIDNLGSWYRHYKIYASSQDLGHVSARQITARRFPSMLTCPGYRVAMDGKAPGVRCLRFDCRFAFLRFLRHFLFKLAAQSSRHGQTSAKPQCSIYVSSWASRLTRVSFGFSLWFGRTHAAALPVSAAAHSVSREVSESTRLSFVTTGQAAGWMFL